MKQIKMITFPVRQKDLPVFWADSGSKMCILILDYGSAYCLQPGPLPAARWVKSSSSSLSSWVSLFNVMSVNAPPACWLSGRFDWTELCWRKMGDDLGDEWWTHEGDQGTVRASVATVLVLQNLLLRVVNVLVFVTWAQGKYAGLFITC